MHSHVGCAVVGQRVVKLWALMNGINALQVIEEQSPSSVRFKAGPIKVELLVTVISSDANHVSFIGNDVSQRELFKKTAQSGIGLAFGHPRLDRNRDVIVRAKLKTYNRMANQG